METEATVLVHIHKRLHGMEISCYSLPRSFGIHYCFFFFNYLLCTLHFSKAKYEIYVPYR